MFEDAVIAELEKPIDEAEELEQMTLEDDNKSYGFGQVGVRLQKRMPLRQPYEQMLQAHMVKLEGRIERKVRKYRKNGDEVKLRKYLREKWAIEGMKAKGLEF
jgi:hypothetical protein